MTADLVILPGARLVTVPNLPDGDRVKIVEWAAYCTGLPDTDPGFFGDDTAFALLRLAAHPSLSGDEFRTAGEEVMGLIQVRDLTDPDDDPMEFHDRTDQALTLFLHGDYRRGTAA